MCGSHYTEKEAGTDEAIKGKFNPKQTGPRIISAKPKNRYYDKQGNLITDPDLIRDIQQGKTVISYKEEKIEGNKEGRKTITRKLR
jgi:hypothetical protein